MASENASADHFSRGQWEPAVERFRVMVVGAHPDDPDFHFGGTASRLAAHGARVVFVSLTNGDKGHFSMSSAELAARRLAETRAAAKVYGLEDYVVMDNRDCELAPTLENRLALTGLVRKFAPHAVFTHRPNDYHADHRATSQLVMDVTYLLGVPLWCPDVPVPKTKPSVWYLRDAFENPRRMRPDLVVELSPSDRENLFGGLVCHRSQFFEWLPFDMGIPADEIPPADDAVRAREFMWRHWFRPRWSMDAGRFALAGEAFEIFELSEYGREPTPEEIRFLKGER